MHSRSARQIAILTLLLCAVPLSIWRITTGRAQQPTAAQQGKAESVRKLSPLTERVVLVSISGLRADYISQPANLPESLRARIPTLLALRAKGAFAIGIDSVYPTQSLPAHATMVTGVLPADHGITADAAFDEQTGAPATQPHWLAKEIKTDTLWDLAGRAGLTTAAIGFPLTAGAKITFNVPDIPGEQGSNASEQLRREYTTPPELLAELSTLTTTLPPSNKKTPPEIVTAQTQDQFRASVAAHVLEKHRPNLLAVRFTSFELAQQKYGIGSPIAAATLERLDAGVARMLATLERAQLTAGTTILLLSDYGVTQIEREFRPNVVLARKNYLTADAQGHITSWRAIAQTFGGSAAIFLKNPQDEATIRELEKIYQELAAESDGPLWRVTNRRETAKLGADPRAVLYLDAAPLYVMSPSLGDSRFANTTERAAHGYLPSRSEMRAALLATGKGIKPGGKIEYARLTDIAPTVARLLGLEMKTARGRLLSEILPAPTPSTSNDK